MLNLSSYIDQKQYKDTLRKPFAVIYMQFWSLTFFTNADLLFNLFSEEGILDTALDSCIHCSHTLVLKAVYILVCTIICHKFENVPLGQY